MAYKMSNGPLQAKLKMVKGPKGEMVPEYAVDGKGANDAAPTKMMKNPVTKMAKSMAYASYEGIGKKVTDPPSKKDVRIADMYAGASGQDLGFAKLEQYRKDNPRAARKMSSEQYDGIIDSYRNAEISRRRAQDPSGYYDTSKLTDEGKKKIEKISRSVPNTLEALTKK
jgi:hypothetical protein